MMGEKESAEQEPADWPEGAHAVYEANVDGRGVPLNVIVDVRRAQGEEGRASAAEQELCDHEDEDWDGCGFGGLFDAVVCAVVRIVVRCQWR